MTDKANQELAEAAQRLVDKLDQVSEDSAGIFSFAAIHGYEYRGAQYGEELEALRAILAQPTEAMRSNAALKAPEQPSPAASPMRAL